MESTGRKGCSIRNEKCLSAGHSPYQQHQHHSRKPPAGTDPVMKRFFLEEKKGAMLPRVAPSLSDKTFWLYKGAYLTDQQWSIRAAGVRQLHIDQAQSLNLYITNEFTMRQVLNLYLLAWECGVKTVYYVRSKSLEVEECESCAS